LPYEFHLSNREDELRARRRERLDGVFEGIEPDLREAARELIQRVFPQTESVWTNIASANERDEWAEQQRVCSSEYFARYFSYAVSATEVGDRELNEALADPDKIAVRLGSLVDRKGDLGTDAILRAISRRTETLDPDRASGVIGVVLGLGPRVSRDSAPRFGELNLEERTASLLAELVLQLPDPSEREAVGERVMETAEPLAFAAECLRWLRLKKSRTDERRPLDDEAWKRVSERLAARIERFADQLEHPIWLEDRGIGLMYRGRDGGQQESMRRHAAKWLDQDPTLVTPLLKAAAGVAYGGSLGMAFQQDLTTDKYEGLNEVADLNDVRTAVMRVRGDAPVPADFPTVRYELQPASTADRLMLDQFAWQDARATAPPESDDS
jgi:hypothetical protein